MSLSGKDINRLRGLAHHLKPIVTVGSAGVTPAVKKELAIALNHHELVKIKLRGDRDARNAWVDEIVKNTGAQKVHYIGQVACFFRRNRKKPVIELPGK